MAYQRKYWERKELEKRRHPSHEVIREFVTPKIKEIREVVAIDKKTKLLDVGGGNGFFSYYFDKICDTTCVDFSETMIRLNPIKKKYLMDANNLKFKNNSFDIVFCHSLLHHVDNISRVLEEMKRVARKYVVILEPNRNNPLIFLASLMIREENKALKFSLSFLKRQVKSQDLKIICSFSCGLITPNKTPKTLLPLLRLFNFKFFMGATNVVVAKKYG